MAYLADVDTTIFDQKAPVAFVENFPADFRGTRLEGITKAQGKAPKLVQDFRRVLDDKSVDAVVIATPDHWHSLATIWACQAGKDVYVEKPLSHNPWEGRKAVEAARKYQRIVQLGTQSRSAPVSMRPKNTSPPANWGRFTFAGCST